MTLLRKPLNWGWLESRPAIFSLAVLVLILFPFIDGHQRLSTGAEVRLRDARWVVTQIDPLGHAGHAGLQVGDVILALDGVTPSSRRLTDPGLAFGTEREWTILRQGERMTLIPDIEQAGWHRIIEPFVMLVIGLAFWGIGTFVRIRRPDSGLASHFYRLNLAVAVVLALSPAGEDDLAWATVLNVLAFSLLPAFIMSFLLWFTLGAPPGGRNTLAVRALYVGGIATGVLLLVADFVGSNLYDPVLILLLSFPALSIIFGLVTLVYAYTHSKSMHDRQQIRIVLLGVAVAALPWISLSLIPESLGLLPIIRPEFAIISAVFLPAAFAYAILRYQLLEIDVVIERTLVYGVMTFLLAGCYALLLYALPFAAGEQAISNNPLLSLSFFAVVTLTFVPVRDRVRRLIDRLIYRDRYDYVLTLRALGTQLVSVRPIDEILSVVANSLRRAMNLRGVAVLLKQPGGGFVIRAASGNYCEEGNAQTLLESAAKRQFIVGEKPGIWLPLVADAHELGFLYLGPKRRQGGFSPEDLSLAENIANQAAMAIINTLLSERLQAKVAELELLRDRLLNVQEEERKHLAQELHDGALHTVMGLVRQATVIAGTLPAIYGEQVLLSKYLGDLAERGQDAVHEIRAVCTDLYPSELTHLGLPVALESLAGRMSREENVLVRFSSPTYHDELRLPEEMEDTLYRVAREALNNVCRHSAASVAWVSLAIEGGGSLPLGSGLRRNDGVGGQIYEEEGRHDTRARRNGQRLVLSIQDDGLGFIVPASFGSLLLQGHLGLVTMRERMEQIGGELVIVSMPGAGTLVRVHAAMPQSSESMLTNEVGAKA